MTNKITTPILLIFSLLLSIATNAEPSMHSNWSDMLSKHVSPSGVVDYEGFKTDRERLLDYVKQISQTDVSKMTKDEELCFWINAYNALTVKLILDNYPVKSIKDIKQADDGPWDIKVTLIGGKKYSLNEIENEVIRKKFDEPRIHFAIVCASYSCPKLRNEAYFPSRLNEQLDQQTKAFVNDEKRNKLSENKAEISQIFDWFKGDFMKSGSVISFLNKYSKVKISPSATISYLDYDWTLNNK
ncbi:MAG: DUF547 domain-containing protein [Flavobacteriales bacterium]|nr:DUF547 domain-containing protein [Flavobacteriales bacterium]